MQCVGWSNGGFEELVERAAGLVDQPGGGRRILGIAGAPASGKSTLAVRLIDRLTERFPGAVTGVGMDAFHLAQRILDRRGLAAVKGAPHTFDVLGYRHLLERIRGTDEVVYAPEFDRGLEDSIAHAVEIGPQIRLIVTEGNYLLLDQQPWRTIRPLLDEAWFVQLDERVRQERLLHRHLSFGHPPADAEARTLGSDQRNAELINGYVIEPDVWVEHLVSVAVHDDR